MKNNETHLENNEKSLKNNEQHLENNEKSLNAVPDFFKGDSGLNKVRMPPRFLRRYAVLFLKPMSFHQSGIIIFGCTI